MGSPWAQRQHFQMTCSLHVALHIMSVFFPRCTLPSCTKRFDRSCALLRARCIKHIARDTLLLRAVVLLMCRCWFRDHSLAEFECRPSLAPSGLLLCFLELWLQAPGCRLPWEPRRQHISFFMHVSVFIRRIIFLNRRNIGGCNQWLMFATGGANQWDLAACMDDGYIQRHSSEA